MDGGRHLEPKCRKVQGRRSVHWHLRISMGRMLSAFCDAGDDRWSGCRVLVGAFLLPVQRELGNDLGNLVSRLLHMCHQYFYGIAPKQLLQEDLEKNLQGRWIEVLEKVLDFYQGYQFHQALNEIIDFVRAINKYADERAPWKLAKSDDVNDKNALATSLATMLEGLRLANELLAPVMPGVHEKICQCLGQESAKDWSGRLDWGRRLANAELGQKIILFPRD